MLTSLRKICNHPALYTPAPDGAEPAAAEDGEGGGAGDVTEFDPDQSGGFQQSAPYAALHIPTSSTVHTVNQECFGSSATQGKATCPVSAPRTCSGGLPSLPGCHAHFVCTVGKMAVLGVLLHEALQVAGDRCVVVSQSTAALDLVQVGEWKAAFGCSSLCQTAQRSCSSASRWCHSSGFRMQGALAPGSEAF